MTPETIEQALCDMGFGPEFVEAVTYADPEDGVATVEGNWRNMRVVYQALKDAFPTYNLFLVDIGGGLVTFTYIKMKAEV